MKSGNSVRGAYLYDAFFKLAKRTVTNTTPAGVTHYLYDPDGHVVAETTSAGVTVREYIWLGDMPIAVIDAVNTASPVTYFVHTDHLMRPLKMTNASGAQVWDAVWKPFGEALTITAAPKLDLVFPGQWWQFENALHGNWHRHYDPTTGRYTRPDAMDFIDGPSLYNYAGGNPLTYVDPTGEAVWAPVVAAAAIVGAFAALDAAMQALENGGNLACIDWRQALAEGIAGALAPGWRAPRMAARGVAAAAKGLSKTGRAGRQARLRELADDPKVSSADRGWIRQEMRSIEQGKQTAIRNPPGRELAHERGREAAKGYDYTRSNLQDRDLHRLQHKYDNFVRANSERPLR